MNESDSGHKYNLKDYKFSLRGQNLLLNPLKCIYWLEKKILLISDLHFGKATHFRKSGIPVPDTVHLKDLRNLQLLISKYNPSRIIFLGDLFHSDYNSAIDDFRSFIEQSTKVKPELVLGNHDVLEQQHYQFMTVYTHELIIPPFILTHKPLSEITNDCYNLCGHIHPSVSIRGPARQSFRVSCFYFSSDIGILPAFGNFTGVSKISIKSNEDQIFAIADDHIIRIQ